jgi:hypothetical protein
MTIPTAVYELRRAQSATAQASGALEHLERAVGTDAQLLAIVGAARIEAREMAKRLARIESWLRGTRQDGGTS